MQPFGICWTRGRVAVTVLAIGAIAVLLTACGGGGSSSSSSESSSSESSGSAAVSSAALKEADEVLAVRSRAPEEPTVGVPLKKRPPEGKTIAFIASSGPTSEINFEGLQEATSSLGWTAKAFYIGSTADEFQAAFTAAAASHPSGVWINALDPSLWESYGEAWEKGGVPVVNQATTWPNVEGEKFNFITIKTNNEIISSMGDWAIADGGGERIGVVTVTAPEIPAYKEIGTTVSKRVEELCPSCSTSVLDVSLSNVGRSIPQEVVSFLQQNPETKYVVFAIGELGVGVPQAISAAGLTGINMGSVTPGPPQRAEVKQGTVAVELAYDQHSQGFVVTDFVARSVNGESTKVDFEWSFPTQFHTQKTVGDPNESWTVPGAAEEWMALWKGE